MPLGHYRVRAGLIGPTGEFYRVYDAGEVTIEGDRRWDIQLSTDATAVEEVSSTNPEHFVLDQNYPNPFNPSTTIGYQLRKISEIELVIYNLIGQHVATLGKEVQRPGVYQVRWDGRDDHDRTLASGVYLYRLKTGTQVQTRKLLLLR